ncbi:MAG: transglutaminase family protein [Patescibacteria group bacterium]|nr:transglutaminase family protein [Patescibacteria group bacterium]
MKLFLRLLVFVIFISQFFLLTKNIYAAGDFDISYDVFYRFLDTENAEVTQKTTIINKKTNLYASEYDIGIFGKIIGDVTGKDEKGSLLLTTTKESDSKTKIHAKFNQQAVGVGNQFTFTINYTLSGLVNNIGRVREVLIPKPGTDSSVVSYNLKILVPKKYGPIAYIKPQKNYEEDETFYIFNFNLEESKNGVLIGFGDTAHFKFKLTYHFINSSLINRETEIALPPDTKYQQVFYSSIDPKPEDVYIDKDGNWLAKYELLPKQSLDVIASGSALIYASPRENFTETPPNETYLKANKFWEVDSKDIPEINRNLKNSADIYDYLLKNFKYNYSRVNVENKRLGALAAIKNPSEATCMEFTDAYVALSRGKGIPAREINGYAYTLDEYLKPLSLVADLLHAWPEYWDDRRKSWIPVDPTWGNTSGLDYFNNLDLNHFVFVRHGISSTYPLSPGNYKNIDKEKDVEVEVRNDLPVITNSPLDFDAEIPQKVISGRELNIGVNVRNLGGSAKYNLPVTIKASNFSVNLPDDKVNLPPFGQTKITVNLKSINNKFWGKSQIIINIGDVQKKYPLEVIPPDAIYLILIIIIFIFLMVSLFIFLKRRYARSQKNR